MRLQNNFFFHGTTHKKAPSLQKSFKELTFYYYSLVFWLLSDSNTIFFLLFQFFFFLPYLCVWEIHYWIIIIFFLLVRNVCFLAASFTYTRPWCCTQFSSLSRARSTEKRSFSTYTLTYFFFLFPSFFSFYHSKLCTHERYIHEKKKPECNERKRACVRLFTILGGEKYKTKNCGFVLHVVVVMFSRAVFPPQKNKKKK